MVELKLIAKFFHIKAKAAKLWGSLAYGRHNSTDREQRGTKFEGKCQKRWASLIAAFLKETRILYSQ